MTISRIYDILYIQSDKLDCNMVVSTRKDETMNSNMGTAELLKETAEENQTRKILEILNESETLEEAREKVKALLKK